MPYCEISPTTSSAAEKLANTILINYENPLKSDTIDIPAQAESLLQSLGATTSDSGGKVTYYGSDPIKPDRLPYGTICAVALAVKSILIAKIWKERTGEGQDIHVDVIWVACDYVAGWLATCGILSALLRRAKEGGSYRVVVSLSRTALWLPELGIFDRDYANKTAGSSDEHVYPDPDGFVVDTPMGRYTGVKEMIEMSKTPGEYKYPLTPLGSWQPSWL
jgi:hypothetical protein